ncbi:MULTISPECIES: hypothetical protein [Bartonella]|uniref:hypothetical protein n=1 Tax=Bartonella TaxID=773 RepID=UPI001ABD4236|nr:hypothetical protein [Bartonella capreoli]
MSNNDATQNADNKIISTSPKSLIITSCYETFADSIVWFNFQNTTPFDIKLHSISGVYHPDPYTDNNWEDDDSWFKVFLSIGIFNAPSALYCHNIVDRVHLISPPEKPMSKVSLKSINIPAYTKCFAIMGIQFWADIDRTQGASIKLTFQFSPTCDFTEVFDTNIFLEGMFLRSARDEAKYIKTAWDEMDIQTDLLKAYQSQGAAFNMRHADCVVRIIP